MAKNKIKTVAKLAVCGMAAFFAANATAMFVSCRNMAKKLKLHEQDNNISHSMFMGNDVVKMTADTKNVFLTCLSGSTVVELREKPVNKDIYLDITAGLGKVVILLPAGVDIWYGGYGKCERIKDVRTKLDAESTCTLHLTRKTLMSRIFILDAE